MSRAYTRNERTSNFSIPFFSALGSNKVGKFYSEWRNLFPCRKYIRVNCKVMFYTGVNTPISRVITPSAFCFHSFISPNLIEIYKSHRGDCLQSLSGHKSDVLCRHNNVLVSTEIDFRAGKSPVDHKTRPIVPVNKFITASVAVNSSITAIKLHKV